MVGWEVDLALTLWSYSYHFEVEYFQITHPGLFLFPENWQELVGIQSYHYKLNLTLKKALIQLEGGDYIPQHFFFIIHLLHYSLCFDHFLDGNFSFISVPDTTRWRSCPPPAWCTPSAVTLRASSA